MSRNVSTTSDQRLAFGHALESAMHAKGMRFVAELHRAGSEAGIAKTAETFATWVRGEFEPARHEVLILEKICGLEPGHLSRHLGWVPVGVDQSATIEQLILADDALSDDAKASLVMMLQTLRNS